MPGWEELRELHVGERGGWRCTQCCFVDAGAHEVDRGQGVEVGQEAATLRSKVGNVLQAALCNR